jgi:hypothetical protein
MFFQENKTLRPYLFGVSKRSKNFFRRLKKKKLFFIDGHKVHKSKAINIVYAFLR